MNILKKIQAYTRNKYYAQIFKWRIKRHAPLKLKNHAEYLEGLFGNLKKKTFFLEFNDGYKIQCSQNDLASIGETCILDDYQKDERYAIKQGDVVLDVGAHIGSFSVHAAYKGAVVYALEPDKENYNKLIQNIKLNNLDDFVTPINKGLYSFTGDLPFYVSDSNLAGHSAIDSTNKKQVSIQVITFGDFCKEFHCHNVDLMKIDIEGGEYDVLANLTKEEFSHIKKIVGEYHLFLDNPYFNFNALKRILAKYFKEVKRFSPYYFYSVK